jgi:diamine N-acetyltransferase
MEGQAAIAHVTLRPITSENLRACLGLRVEESQDDFVASNADSLAEARTNPNLFPYAVYAGTPDRLGAHDVPMVGFTMIEIDKAIGFILRLMIDRAHQRRGYGRAATEEVIRRLRLHPEVQMIATSHRTGNTAAARLYEGLGFVDWKVEWVDPVPNERYLRLA